MLLLHVRISAILAGLYTFRPVLKEKKSRSPSIHSTGIFLNIPGIVLELNGIKNHPGILRSKHISIIYLMVYMHEKKKRMGYHERSAFIWELALAPGISGNGNKTTQYNAFPRYNKYLWVALAKIFRMAKGADRADCVDHGFPEEKGVIRVKILDSAGPGADINTVKYCIQIGRQRVILRLPIVAIINNILKEVIL